MQETESLVKELGNRRFGKKGLWKLIQGGNHITEPGAYVANSGFLF